MAFWSSVRNRGFAATERLNEHEARASRPRPKEHEARASRPRSRRDGVGSMATIELDGTKVHTLGELPAIGSKAPDFTLTRSDFAQVKLSDFVGKRVVLNIFPSIATGVCQATARYFNEAADELENAVVLTVSMDLPFPLQTFKAAEGIDSAIMTSAFRSDFGQRYQAVMTDGAWEGLLSRAVVVLDADHRVVYTEQVPKIGQEPDYEAAFEALQRA